MIILIGGMSHTGKTLLAQKLLEKHKITYLSLDHLKMGLCRGLDTEKYSPIQDYKVLGEKLWPIVKGIIMTNVENEQSIIIEGCYILPHLIRDLKEEYLKETVSIFMGFSTEYIKIKYKKDIKEHSSAIELRGYEISEPMETYIKQTAELKAECEKVSQKYFEIENDYNKEMEAVVEYIRGKIKQ